MDRGLSGTVMSLRNLNIAPRAFLGFAVIGLLMLILGIFALSQMNKINNANVDLATNSVPSIKALDKLTEGSIRLRVLSYRLMLNRDPDTLQKTTELFAMRNKQIDDARAVYVKLISEPAEQSAYDQYVQLLNDYRQLENRMKTLSQANDMAELIRLLSADLQTNSDQMNTALAKLIEMNTQQVNEASATATQQYSTAFTMVVTLLIIATVLTLLFAWLLTNSITRPIASALHAAEDIAEGDLTRTITVDGTDEAGRLLAAMLKMQSKLRDTLLRISGSATQLASAAEELNTVTDESARGFDMADVPVMDWVIFTNNARCFHAVSPQTVYFTKLLDILPIAY